jgi:predicted MFS family arabinose efflux permease
MGWRVVFHLQAVLSAVALLLAIAVLRETRPQRVRFDVPGGLALAVGVAGFMVALGLVRELGVSSPWIPTAAVVGAVGIAAFIRLEGRVEAPLLPLGLFREGGFSATLATNASNSGAYLGAFVIAPLLLFDAFDFSVTQASLLMLARTASLTVSSPFGGILGERIGERLSAAWGGAVMTLALGFMAWSAWTSSLVGFVIGLVGQGVGHGLSQPSITSAVARAVPETELGVASAANRLAGQAGAAFGIAALTLAYGGVATPGAFAGAFAWAAAFAALSILTALGMKR